MVTEVTCASREPHAAMRTVHCVQAYHDLNDVTSMLSSLASASDYRGILFSFRRPAVSAEFRRAGMGGAGDFHLRGPCGVFGVGLGFRA